MSDSISTADPARYDLNSRRAFLVALASGLAGLVAGAELDLDRLLWVPGQRKIFLPPAPSLEIYLNFVVELYHGDHPLPEMRWTQPLSLVTPPFRGDLKLVALKQDVSRYT